MFWGGGLIFKRITAIFCFTSACFGCDCFRNVNASIESNIKHLVMGIYWRAHASLRVNDEDCIRRNEWFTDKEAKNLIYNLLANGISDCATRQGIYAGYGCGNFVEYSIKPTAMDYTQSDWSLLVYHNFLARSMTVGNTWIDTVSDEAVENAGKAVLDRYRYQIKNIGEKVRVAVDTTKIWAHDLHLYEFIEYWNKHLWNPYIDAKEYGEYIRDLCEHLKNSKGNNPDMEEYRKVVIAELSNKKIDYTKPCFYIRDCLDYLQAGARATFLKTNTSSDSFIPSEKTSSDDWLLKQTELRSRRPVVLYVSDNFTNNYYHTYTAERMLKPIYFMNTIQQAENVYKINANPYTIRSVAPVGLEIHHEQTNPLSGVLDLYAACFLLPNLTYPCVLNKPNTRKTPDEYPIDFRNVAKGFTHTLKEYSPERIEQEARKKGVNMIKLEEYVGEKYYVRHGIGRKVKKETNNRNTCLDPSAVNRINNIYNLKTHPSKEVKEYSPERIKKELKQENAKILTLEREVYTTHYLHSGKSYLVHKEVHERVRSLSKSPKKK